MAGRQWRPAKQPVKVNGHDFPDPAVPRAYPYGVYDLGRNPGFVNVGTDHDTGAFAVASIRGWWRYEGRRLYPQARELLHHGGWRREAMDHDCDSGNWNCRSWPMKPDSGFGSAIFHRAID